MLYDNHSPQKSQDNQYLTKEVEDKKTENERQRDVKKQTENATE